MNFLDPRLPESFWSKCMPEPMSGCWLWLACHSGAGYGQVRRQGVTHYAHRVAYSAANGLPERGLELDHKCRVRGCCNPAHLEAVTHAENMRRSPFMRTLGAEHGGRKREDRCACGREWDQRLANGQPVCTVCRLNRQRAWHQRRRQGE